MKYQLHSVSHREGFRSHLLGRMLSLGIGATLGFYMGAMVVIGEIQASTPVHIYDTPASSLQVKPVEVDTFAELTEPNDIQAALGYNALQPTTTTSEIQPAAVLGTYQNADRVGKYQHTVTDYQLQGEQLPVSQLKVQTQ